MEMGKANVEMANFCDTKRKNHMIFIQYECRCGWMKVAGESSATTYENILLLLLLYSLLLLLFALGIERRTKAIENRERKYLGKERFFYLQASTAKSRWYTPRFHLKSNKDCM